MSVYELAIGPAAALIGIVAVFFVMRSKSKQTRSMYSSRRSNLERKVKAARQRTLAPHGRTGRAPTEAEIAAATPMPAAPIYEAQRSPSWDTGPTPAPSAFPPPAPDFAAAPSAPDFAAAPSAPAEPYAPAQPEWTTPAVSEPVWTPAPAAEVAPAPMAQPAAPEPAVVPSGEGASWSIVGGEAPAAADAAPAKDKGKDKDKGRRKDKQAATGGSWELASGDAPGSGAEEDDEPKAPSSTMAVVQYVVFVLGLGIVLMGVLIMISQSHVT